MFPYLSNHVLKLLSTMCAKHYYQTCVTHVLEKYVLHILNFSKTCVAKTCVLKTCVLKTCVTHENVKTCVLKTCIFGALIEKGRIENVCIENMCNTCFVKRVYAAHVFKRMCYTYHCCCDALTLTLLIRVACTHTTANSFAFSNGYDSACSVPSAHILLSIYITIES